MRSSEFATAAKARPFSGGSHVSFARETNNDLRSEALLPNVFSMGQVAASQQDEEEQKKSARNRLARIESAKRVRTYQRKEKRKAAREAKMKKMKSESILSVEKTVPAFQPHEAPAFFDL